MNALPRHRQRCGFTLVELMVAMFISIIASAGMYRIYVTFTAAFEGQEDIAAMQQNMRIGMQQMVRDLRLAGCDPRQMTDSPGFVLADNDSVHFTMDITGGENDDEDNDFDGEINEADEVFHGDKDVEDSGEDILYELDAKGSLLRSDDPVVENVEVLNFVYLDEAGNVLTPLPLDAANRALVRSVEVTLVVRAANMSATYTNNTSYKNMRGDTVFPAAGDHYRRRVFSARVRCRNRGLY